MEAFSILGLLEENDQRTSGNLIKDIPIDAMIPSKHNFYDTNEIEEIKASFRLFGDVQVGIVSPLDDGTYRIVAGHRRHKAHQELTKEGYEGFEMMRCVVREGDPDNEDIANRLLLILTNSLSRNLSDYEKTRQAAELKGLLEKYKEQGNEIPGVFREYIANTLKVSPTQVQRYDSINKNLSDDFMEEFKEEKINVSVASELATMPHEKQAEALEVYKQKGKLEIKDVKQMKQEEKPDFTYNIDQEMYRDIVRGERSFVVFMHHDQQPKQQIKFVECNKNMQATGRELLARITVVDTLQEWAIIGFRR